MGWKKEKRRGAGKGLTGGGGKGRLRGTRTARGRPGGRILMMSSSWIRCVAAVMALAAGVVCAEGQVVVSKNAGGKTGVDVTGMNAAGGAASVQALRVLKSDLERSGLVKLEGAGLGAYSVSGTVTDNASGTSIRCTMRNAGGQVVMNQVFGQPRPHTAAHQAAQAIVKAATGKDSFLTARLAAIGVSGNSKRVYISDYAMLSPMPIWNDPNASICLKPRWSWDNRIISFTSYARRFPDVYTYDTGTGQISCVAHYPGVNSGGAISPDGRWMALVLSKDGNPDLYVLELATRKLTRLTTTPRAVEGSPCWSPDGSRIAYVSNVTGMPQLYVIGRGGGQPVRLTMRGTQNVAPDWGKNGLIAYQTLQGGSQFQIAVIDPQSKMERVITPYDASYEDPSWAPDGRHIAAARSVRYQSAIYLLDTEGDKPVALTTAGDWRAPSWTH